MKSVFRVGLFALALVCACGRAASPASVAPAGNAPDGGHAAGDGSDAGSPPAVVQPPAGGPAGLPVASGGWRWENPLPSGASLTGVWAASGDDIWAVGEGTLLHFDGASWTKV